jgi:predicted DCC family thiol-disulfide oxidoreductase YuxK|tara:strand:+ start:3863 stop:4282 length:420 start_codon:yes stop_codon:yes gene_type:complete
VREDVSGQEILLVYDKQCPACDKYCQRIDIHQLAGPLRLVDARHPSDVLAEVTAQGLDIDQGMVVKMGGELYYGADAIHALALISSRSGIFSRLNFWVFRSATVSRLIYPSLKMCRNLLLKTLGVTKINNLGDSGKERF